MRQPSRLVQFREGFLAFLPVIAVVALLGAVLWLGSRYVGQAPPKQLEIATATEGSPYYNIARRLKALLARDGVSLVVRQTRGSFDNLALLANPNSGVKAGIVQGGLAASAHGAPLLSLGRIAYEPLWIFYRGEGELTRIADLKGKRILIGPEGGGTIFVATKLLAASGVTNETATLVPAELFRYPELLAAGQVDAGFLVLAPDARTIQALFAVPDLKLMSLVQADALAQRFPFVTRLELKQGIIDFARGIPAQDIHLVATLAALVVRDDLHPALASLLTQAIAADSAEPPAGPNGEAPILRRSGDFPVTTDPEYPMSDDARRFYKSGPPFLQRYLPFWLATQIDRLLVLILPVAALLLPALRLGPMLYNWQMRRRLLYWYRELKRVERGITSEASASLIAAKRAEVEDIEEAVNDIPLPLAFTSQLYDLREHIDMVRRRLAGMAADAVRRP